MPLYIFEVHDDCSLLLEGGAQTIKSKGTEVENARWSDIKTKSGFERYD